MPRSSLHLLAVVSILLGGHACVRGVWAAPPSEELQIGSVQLGFGGTYKVGHCTPARIEVRGVRNGQNVGVEITARDGEGIPTTFVLADQTVRQVATSGTAMLQGYVKPGPSQGDLTVRLIRNGSESARRLLTGDSLPKPLASTDELILTFGKAAGIEDAVKKARRARSRRTRVQAVDDPAEAPTEWYGYEGVDWVVATTSDENVLEKMSDMQFAAFDRWLQLGGRLVFCVGRRGEQILAPDSRLARFAPGREARVVPQRVTSGLENYAGSEERLDVAGGERNRRFSVPMTSLSDVHGAVESDEIGGAGRLPTVVRSPYGLGQIVFLAFDPDLAPFDQWQGRPALMARVLQFTGTGRQREADNRAVSGQLGQLGYQDILGQLRSALDQFDDTTRVQFSWVAGLIAIYILLIGPGDYLLLKTFRRMHWTWISFPLLSILFCLLIYFLVTRFSGGTLHINQVDVVDMDMEASVTRGTSWTHIYSPVAQTFQLTLEPHAPWRQSDDDIQGRLLTWQGLPGAGLGGLDAGSPTALFPDPYEIFLPTRQHNESGGRIDGMPITVSGSKSLLGQWWSADGLNVDERLTINRNGLLSGTLSNPLSIDLSDCRVLYQNWIYPLTGGLRAGQSVSFDGVKPKNLEWHLTRRRVIDTQDVKTTWDPSGTDVPRMIEMMMFYEAAEGDTYTKLTHRYQSTIDLSDHLRGGRAILVGRGSNPASELSRGSASLTNNYDRHWAFYRLIFPVDQPERP